LNEDSEQDLEQAPKLDETALKLPIFEPTTLSSSADETQQETTQSMRGRAKVSLLNILKRDEKKDKEQSIVFRSKARLPTAQE